MGAFCRVVLVVALAVIVGRWCTIPADGPAADGPNDPQRQWHLATGARNSTWSIYQNWSRDHATTPLYASLLRAELLHREAMADPTVAKLRASRHAFDEVLYCMNHATCEQMVHASEEGSHVVAFRESDRSGSPWLIAETSFAAYVESRFSAA